MTVSPARATTRMAAASMLIGWFASGTLISLVTALPFCWLLNFPRGSAADEVELVAFWVGEGHPVVAVLLDIADGRGAQTGQSADFGVPVGGGQVKVQPVFDGLAFRDLVEDQAWHRHVGRPDGHRCVS